MMRRQLLRVATLAATTVILATCKDTTAGPRPGYLEIRLTSPNIDDGGLHFTVGGARIDSVTTNFPLIASHVTSDSLWHVVVGGSIGTGTVAKVWVPDTRLASHYTGTVLEVVVRTTNAQRPATGYAIVPVAAQ